jgi:hypothetical protein
MDKRCALVLAVDGWGAGFLGPYGNTWLETPACNRLASRGMLVEHALVDAPTIDSFYRAAWGGAHAALPARHVGRPLAEDLRRQGRSSCLITDAPSVAEHALADCFGRAEGIAGTRPREAAESPEQTELARLFAAALSTLEQDPADLIWIHSAAMTAAWDAPQPWRDQFCDEDDPPPPVGVDPPTGPVSGEWDPDDLQGWIWAYAAQVALLDWGLAALLESWQQIREPALLVVMGTRGFGLAEHGVLGDPLDSLHGEHLHVPLMVLSNQLELAGVRSQQLVQPRHIWQTLLDWFGVEPEGADLDRSLLQLPANELQVGSSTWPPLAVARLGERWALRTPAWHASISTERRDGSRRRDKHGPVTHSSPVAACQLYLKPDDRWEVNDVADRCPDVVETFIELQQAITQLSPDADFEQLLPLPESLQAPPD